MTASLFGYISSMVFKREIWDQVTPSRYAIGSAYPQVYRALGIVFGAPGKFHYLAQPIANNRRNNCSYTEEFGEILRYMIDLRMFRIVIDEYFSSDLQIRNRFKKFVRACFGRMAYERIRTGIVAMDELIEFFEADDAVMPQINHWVLHPVVERAYRRFQENGIEQQCFSGKSILHIGYRHQGSAILKPINRKAIGIEPGFSGYDGVHLPYETASQDTLYACNFFPQKSDEGSVFREWMRVLRDGAYIVITNSLGPAGDHSHDVKISTILASIEAALPVDHFQIVHCSQSFPDPAAPQVSEVDIVVRKLASLTASSSLTPDQAAPAKVEAMQVAAPAELLAQALRSHSSGDGDNAAMLAQKVLQSEPRNGVALQLLGLIAYQKSDHALAIIRFSDALKVGPSSADVYLNLGCAYAALGGNGEAIECFTTALKLRPGFGSAQANLAILRAAEGKDDASRQNFLQVLAQSPQLTEAHSLLNMKVPA